MTPAHGPVAVLVALEEERHLLLEALTDRRDDEVAGRAVSIGSLDGHPVVICRAGMGKVNVALLATLVVERFAPSTLVFSGVAGGIDPTLDVGDVVVAAHTIQHDAGFVEGGRTVTYQAGHLPFVNATDRLGYAVDPALLARVGPAVGSLDLVPVRDDRPPRVVLGTVVTGDVFVNDAATRERLHATFDAAAVEMEGAALAQVAEELGVAHLVVRALSDLAGAEPTIDFERFVRLASVNSATVIRAVLSVL